MNNNEKIQILPLNETHLEKIMELQHIVMSSLDNPDFYASIAKEEFERQLRDPGIAVGAFLEKELCSYFVMVVPGERSFNLGRDINLNPEELDKVIHYETAAVHPKYRGNHLQMEMANELKKLVSKNGKWRYTMSTVSPFNYPSLKTVFTELNLVARKLYLKYGGKLRYILYQDLQKPLILDKENSVCVLSSDIEKQEELFSIGYYAYDIKKEEGMDMTYFAKEENVV